MGRNELALRFGGIKRAYAPPGDVTSTFQKGCFILYVYSILILSRPAFLPPHTSFPLVSPLQFLTHSDLVYDSGLSFEIRFAVI